MAINRLLRGVGVLIHSKQIFMASAAHQLRTPLAAMLIELDKIEDERARDIEKDVANLSETVDRLLTLVRLQAMESPDFVDFNIGAVAEDAVRGLRAWAQAQHHHIQILSREPGNLSATPLQCARLWSIWWRTPSNIRRQAPPFGLPLDRVAAPPWKTAGPDCCLEGRKTCFVHSAGETAQREVLGSGSRLSGKPLSCTAARSRSGHRRWVVRCFVSNSVKRGHAVGSRRQRRTPPPSARHRHPSRTPGQRPGLADPLHARPRWATPKLGKRFDSAAIAGRADTASGASRRQNLLPSAQSYCVATAEILALVEA